MFVEVYELLALLTLLFNNNINGFPFQQNWYYNSKQMFITKIHELLHSNSKIPLKLKNINGLLNKQEKSKAKCN